MRQRFDLYVDLVGDIHVIGHLHISDNPRSSRDMARLRPHEKVMRQFALTVTDHCPARSPFSMRMIVVNAAQVRRGRDYIERAQYTPDLADIFGRQTACLAHFEESAQNLMLDSIRFQHSTVLCIDAGKVNRGCTCNSSA
jgi:hypothetical protein